ncbi:MULTISPECIES: DUF58 domain-containing protein [Parafrankia]|uniref:DUF58 domain-containing protein n=1 Tax=Parafrankia soli TaxID=2599596 RepID=A0A1S1QUS0_9ACTN|nr:MULTISPECIES: DUF58 domain-containing protein [Parafrankia]OHV37356.1 hypothetical protein BBK14_03095 [Parafrankia soli]TCJ36206.1 DUF58 domain-containing protein [Parafrankia sp. BMG5.11]SQE00547.1 conserved hypothetical protein [Parafrankia sp. Ea1.12]
MTAPRADPAAPQPAATSPSVERTLRGLELTVTRRLDGMLLGDHLGLLPGQGTEKAESREYNVGDDVRRMDWAVTARTTVPHVHDLIADRELETWALVDLTASQEFGTTSVRKRDLAIAAVAAIGFLTARTGNRMGAVALTPAGPRVIPARPGRQGLRTLLRTLLTVPEGAHDRPLRRPDPAAATDLAAAIAALDRPRRRRGLAVVVSDFLSTDLDWERPMRVLAARHQLLAVEVLDPAELTLPAVGLLPVVDAETGELVEVPTSSRRLRERYRLAAAEHRSQVALALRRAGAGHLVLRTDSDWLIDIVRFVSASRTSRGAARRPPVDSTRLPGHPRSLPPATGRGRPGTAAVAGAGGRRGRRAAAP